MTDKAILITGSSGFLGSLVAAKALMETEAPVVLPLREPERQASVLARIASELAAEGRRTPDEVLRRVVIVGLPASERIEELVPALRSQRVGTILHCAGSVESAQFFYGTISISWPALFSLACW